MKYCKILEIWRIVGVQCLIITHDIDAALKIADRVAIFYAGTTLEIANVRRL